MPIAALFIILAGGATVAILYPQLRIAAAIVLAVFTTVVAAYFFIGGSTVVQQHVEITADEVLLTDVTLTEERGYTILAGRVQNASEAHNLRDFDVELRFLDCPAPEGDLSDCAIIADETALTRVAVPPGQTRAFRTIFRRQNLPDLRGTLRWDWRITDATTSDI
ncbi:MAG: hypothetical protein AAFY59_20105 [Pseudomonadota bacterium]